MNRIQTLAACCLLSCVTISRAQNTPVVTSVVAPDYSAHILTPLAPLAPRINGPRIYGQRPGQPFAYRIPATGRRPMQFVARGLPRGLKLDAQSGQISGVVAKAGRFRVSLRAKNALGRDVKPLEIVIGDRLALTPALGWNSWNSFAGSVDQGKVLRAAQILVSSGLINHGWSYVNIDDTWQGERTGQSRALQGNSKFPDMKALCAQIHQMGLKAGIYSSPWVTTYAHYAGGSSDNPAGTWDRATQANNPNWRFGAHHFATIDAKQWVDWGFDYLKYDWNPNDIASTTEMSEALLKSGRDIVFSLSNSAPFKKADTWSRLSNVWRTTGDIADDWGRSKSGWQCGMAEIGFSQGKWAPFAGPGHWNDPDMLVVGVVGLAQPMHPTRLSPDEQFTHITLWSLLSAPLLIGCDLEKIDAFTLSLLSNDEVLAVNQDALGKQAVQVAGPEFVPPAPSDTLRDNPGGNALVYARPLADGTQAVGLFNVGSAPLQISADFATLKLQGAQKVRDLWRQKDLGRFQKSFSALVPPHGTVLVKIGTPRG